MIDQKQMMTFLDSANTDFEKALKQSVKMIEGEMPDLQSMTQNGQVEYHKDGTKLFKWKNKNVVKLQLLFVGTKLRYKVSNLVLH